MLMEANACPRTAESRAGRRSSGQLTVRDANPTHVCPFKLDVTPDAVFELGKRFHTHHTVPSSQVNSAITLGCANWLVASVICY